MQTSTTIRKTSTTIRKLQQYVNFNNTQKLQQYAKLQQQYAKTSTTICKLQQQYVNFANNDEKCF